MQIRFAALLLVCLQIAHAEQFLVLTSGKKYLGNVSSADKTKFIFCDAKVGNIPGGSRLEDTFEKCGSERVLDRATYDLRLRLVTISEGAAKSDDKAFAKETLGALERIQEMNDGASEQEAKAAVKKAESKAGTHLQIYLDKGQASAPANSAQKP